MSKSEEELEADRRQMAQGQTGGGTSRGPETTTTPNTEAQNVDPPHGAPASGEAKGAAQEGVHKAFDAKEHGGEPASPPPVTKEEREAVSPTDTTGATPLGVGESTGASGEEAGGKEAGRQDTGTEGGTGRPTGESSGRDVTGVNPSKSGTMESDAN